MSSSSLAALARRHYEHFNARDLDAYASQMTPGVEVMVEDGVLSGRDAVKAYTARVLAAFPTMRLELQRIVAEGPDVVVAEMRIHNMADEDRPPSDDWDLQGLTYQVIQVAGGQISAIRSCYVTHAEDRTDVPQLPRRDVAIQAITEQAALRRVATLVACDAGEAEVLAAVCREVGRIVDADATSLFRFGPGETLALVAAWRADGAPPLAGDRRPVDAGVRELLVSGRPKVFAAVPGQDPAPEGTPGPPGHSALGVPISVDGAVWGAIFASWEQSRPLRAGAEARIARFTELASTALGNAQARAEREQAALEQAALLRVAELGARGTGQIELLDAVVGEASQLLGRRGTTILRRDGPGTLTVVASCGGPTPVGTRIAARVGDEQGVESGLTVPIVVEGEVWGTLAAAVGEEPLSPLAEPRLQQLAALTAAALRSALARDEAHRLASEQAALRRVAELVARGAAPDEVMAAVAREAAALLGEAMTLVRYTGASTLVASAVCGGPGPVGWSLDYERDTLPDLVRTTGAPVRVDDYAAQPDSELAASLGMAAAVGVPITVDGRSWGMLQATSPDRPLPRGTEERLLKFADLVGAAIANADSRAQLHASRARVVATADETRRRMQRDVHDGAQQRLVQTVITLKLARRATVEGDQAAAGALVEEALLHAERATAGLRDVVRGIMPDALSQGGLQAGIESLLDGLPLPVKLDVAVDRLRDALETTAYFVVAEALTNVVKHAEATQAEVSIAAVGEHLTIEVRDDGIGGADASGGSGLTGLFDRVHAGDGELRVVSPPGAGTLLHARLPLGSFLAFESRGDASAEDRPWAPRSDGVPAG